MCSVPITLAVKYCGQSGGFLPASIDLQSENKFENIQTRTGQMEKKKFWIEIYILRKQEFLAEKKYLRSKKCEATSLFNTTERRRKGVNQSYTSYMSTTNRNKAGSTTANQNKCPVESSYHETYVLACMTSKRAWESKDIFILFHIKLESDNDIKKEKYIAKTRIIRKMSSINENGESSCKN